MADYYQNYSAVDDLDEPLKDTLKAGAKTGVFVDGVGRLYKALIGITIDTGGDPGGGSGCLYVAY